WTVGHALGLRQDRLRDRVVIKLPLGDVLVVEGVDAVVVRIVDILLVHVEPNQRPLGARRRHGRAALGLGRFRSQRSGHYGAAGDQRAAGHRTVGRLAGHDGSPRLQRSGQAIDLDYSTADFGQIELLIYVMAAHSPSKTGVNALSSRPTTPLHVARKTW